MKKIKSFADVDRIIENRCDIRDDLNRNISFLKFLNMKLIEVHTIIENGEYTYDPN